MPGNASATLRTNGRFVLMDESMTNPLPSHARQRRPISFLRRPGVLPALFLLLLTLACLGSLPWSLSAGWQRDGRALPRFNAGDASDTLRPPLWWRHAASLQAGGVTLRDHAWTQGFFLGSDILGRSLFIRCLTGGAISLSIGVAASFIAVVVGTMYGSLAGYLGGRWDATLMRIVDVLYGLPYVLLVVLLAVASSSLADEYVSRSRERERWIERSTLPGQRADDTLRAQALRAVPPRDLSTSARTMIDLGTLLIAISGVSWLTMARVVRGQVLSLKERAFIDAARALGASHARIFLRHLLPNLTGTIIVYATLTVPQAILQESFLSFLGIGVKPPLPSWGTLAADALPELNPYQSHWWLLVFPCLLLACTLLSLNFMGEALRERLDPRSTTARSIPR